MGESLKKELRSEYIKLRCTPHEKEMIQNRAATCGALSVSEFLLTLGLDGHTQEYSSARRNADGALLTAEIYKKLFEMIDTLKRRPDSDNELLKEAIALIHEVRRDITINRLRTSVERMMME